MARSEVVFTDGGLEKALRNALKKSRKHATRAATECAIDLAAKSSQLAPIDMGDLRNNCKAVVNGVVVYANQQETGLSPQPFREPEVEVSYDLIYARRQHEELSYRHPKGGQAKYLEEPFLANATQYAERIRKAVIDALD